MSWRVFTSESNAFKSSRRLYRFFTIVGLCARARFWCRPHLFGVVNLRGVFARSARKRCDTQIASLFMCDQPKPRALFVAMPAHDPEKCARFSDKIMRKIKKLERDAIAHIRIAL
jgi:hypothetical protein